MKVLMVVRSRKRMGECTTDFPVRRNQQFRRTGKSVVRQGQTLTRFDPNRGFIKDKNGDEYGTAFFVTTSTCGARG